MLKFTMPSKKKPGAAPGTLVHTGAPKSGPVRITLTDYDREQVREQPDSGIDDVISFKELPSVSWINVDGVYDVDLIARIGQEFAIHPLTLEDIVNTAQRPNTTAHRPTTARGPTTGAAANTAFHPTTTTTTSTPRQLATSRQATTN